MAADGTNNFYDGGQPDNDWFPDFINRYDYNINQRQHLSGKWYFNSRLSDQYDWAHGTPAEGRSKSERLVPAHPRAVSLDYLFTSTPITCWTSVQRHFSMPKATRSPSCSTTPRASVGLPAYIGHEGRRPGLSAVD